MTISPQAESLLKLLHQTRDEAVLLLDTHGVIRACLPAAALILGYSESELVGKNIDILFVPEDRDRGIPALELRIAAADGRSENERWHLRKDGARFWGSGTFTALRDEHGEILGFGKIFRDHTEFRLRIETLENKADTLEQKVQRYKFGFATVGHEFRNPLNALNLAAKALRSVLPAGTGEEALGIIDRQGELMKSLTDDLVELARADGGKSTVDLQPIDLNEIVRSCVHSSHALIEDKQQTVRLLLQSVPLMVNGEPAKLMQIVVNLLTNAVRYTLPEGNIWIKTTTEAGEAVLRVEDDGVGIPKEMLSTVFDLFAQVESDDPANGRRAGKGPGKGLGVGLTLVRDYVGLHGGSVQARSDGANRGSQFTVRLPLLD